MSFHRSPELFQFLCRMIIWTEWVLPRNVPMHGANAECWRQCVVGQAKALSDRPHQSTSLSPVTQLLAQKDVLYCAAGVEGLQIVLMLQHLEEIVAIADGKMGLIRIVWRLLCSSGDNTWELLLIGTG